MFRNITAVNTIIRLVFSFIICVTVNTNTSAQTNAFQSITQDFDSHRKKALQEKLFLHIDRSVYTCGETLWFKIYNVDGTVHKPLDISKVAYVEVVDDTKKSVLQAKVAMEEGMGKGSFVLPVSLPSGNYSIRAYTNWMKNFSPDFFFEQAITIVNTFQKLPATTESNAPQYSIQFFPEGGNLVAGVTNKVAFKAMDRLTGKGVNFTGELLDQQGKKVAEFGPHKFGLGNFTFTPVTNAKYTAVITPAGTQTKVKEELPAVHDRGYSLQIEEGEIGKLKVAIHQVGQPNGPVYLLGHARQIIAVTEAVNMYNGIAEFQIDKNNLSEGITHFTLFDSQKKPVCERLYFKQPKQKLQLTVRADKPNYSTRGAVTLNIQSHLNDNSPSQANLSLAVFKLDSLQGTTSNYIENYLWLTSDLKGSIENPAYYFSELGASDLQAIDNLMLTHGWSRFKWEDILDKSPVMYEFVPEYNGHQITGKVTHKSTGKPASGITTYLASPSKHIRLYNSKSNSNGSVFFEVKDFFGDKDVVLQSDYTNDSTYHFEIFSPFSKSYANNELPQLQLPATLRHDLTSRHIQMQSQQAYYGNFLNRFSPAGVDSVAFYGVADESYFLDDYKRFKVMEEVLREYVPGVMVRKRGSNFRFMVFDKPYKSLFQENPIVLLDGVPVFNINKIIDFDPLKVKKLEVVTSHFLNGPLVHKGLVSFTTYSGNMAGFDLNPNALMQAYEGLQLQREFYSPSYETDAQKQNHLADFRNLLYWAPELKINAEGKHKLQFYTSDLSGKYLIVVQGLTKDGVAGHSSYTLEVK